MIRVHDLATQRRQSDKPASVGDTSILFGALLCCFAFGMTFMATVCGVPS